MTAGSGDMAVSWKPCFRFPGQFEEEDMGLAATGRSLFVQNHYREYLPRFGLYNRVDPISGNYSGWLSPYIYCNYNPYKWEDRLGLFPMPPIVVPPSPIAPICAYIIYRIVKNDTMLRGMDKQMHCVASCEIHCYCADLPTTVLFGLLKEIADMLGFGTPDIKDLLANWKGIKCSYGIDKEDSPCCEKIEPCNCRKCCRCITL